MHADARSEDSDELLSTSAELNEVWVLLRIQGLEGSVLIFGADCTCLT